MMHQISDDNFESFLASILDKDIIDMRGVTFIDPFGMVGILEVGRFLNSRGVKKDLLLPSSENVVKYLERMDFFRFAPEYFNICPALNELPGKFLRSSCSDVLLEITPIAKSDDIHYIVGKVKKRAKSILAKHLHYDENAISGFIVALSEVCQNIVEHSENTGFVGIQKYYFQKYGKNVVKIAVMDLGMGFRSSLAERLPVSDDMEAIEKALVYGYSRHSDEGRGHGLASVRRFIGQWNGKIAIRSGTARMSIIPEWAWGRSREKGLLEFPGSQINIMLPEI